MPPDLPVERLTYTVPELARALGIGVTQAYALANSGAFPVRRAGNRILIARAAVQRWLESPDAPPARLPAMPASVRKALSN